jgi:hypothetical protein
MVFRALLEPFRPLCPFNSQTVKLMTANPFNLEPPDKAAETIKPWYHVGKAVFDGAGEAIAAAQSVDDARRMAAALNAVIGMPTEALEAWTLGSIQDPTNDLLAELESVLAPPAPEDRRRSSDRRQTDRRRAITEVRLESL